MITTTPKTERGKKWTKRIGLIIIGTIIGAFLCGMYFGSNYYSFEEYIEEYSQGLDDGFEMGYNYTLNEFMQSCVAYYCENEESNWIHIFGCDDEVWGKESKDLIYHQCADIYNYDGVGNYKEYYFEYGLDKYD